MRSSSEVTTTTSGGPLAELRPQTAASGETGGDAAAYQGAQELVGQIAANTSRIRVGSGGVMLTHYSAFKVGRGPEKVHHNLHETAERYGTIDISIVTNAYCFGDRARSYELVAEVMGFAP